MGRSIKDWPFSDSKRENGDRGGGGGDEVWYCRWCHLRVCKFLPIGASLERVAELRIRIIHTCVCL